MNWEMIEREAATPRPPRVTPEDRQAHAAKADPCVKWLKLQGFDVLYVQRGLVNSSPRIIIRAEPLCDQLEGAVHRFERVGKVESRYCVAIRFGCEVRWYGHSTGSGRTGWGAVMATAVGVLSARIARKIGVAA